MKIIDNYVEEVVQSPGVDGIYGIIRDCAAVCYQTDVEKMTLPPKDFVERVLIKNGHGRPLEFGTVYLMCNSNDPSFREFVDVYDVLCWNPCAYTEVADDGDGSYTLYITTNMRVLAQGGYSVDKEAFLNGYDRNFFGMLKFLCEPTEHHRKRRIFRMVMSRGCTDDLRTHVTMSSLCESTRFCNYSSGKFGGDITFIKPYWFTHEVTDEGDIDFYYYDESVIMEEKFLLSMKMEEAEYMRHAHMGMQPQQLKRLYPLGAKAELLLCGDDKAWKNFFWRRCDAHADPECVKVACMIRKLYNDK